jgi:hypothetical protein
LEEREERASSGGKAVKIPLHKLEKGLFFFQLVARAPPFPSRTVTNSTDYSYSL